MPHPWDLWWVWLRTTEPRLQLQCVATGLLGSEAALNAQLELASAARDNAAAARAASAALGAAKRRRRP